MTDGIFKVYLPWRKDQMVPETRIVKTELVGGYVWIEHDDLVGLDSRIFVLHTQAPGHASFAMGSALARDVGAKLGELTKRPVQLNVGEQYTMEERRPPTFWEWLTRKRVVRYDQAWQITNVVTGGGDADVSK